VSHSPDPDDPAEPLTAEEERELAALLADSAGRGPVTPPPHVVARLDAVLAELVAERAAEERPTTAEPGEAPAGGGTVVPLEARRRRLPRVLLAAAAVVVGGYAVGNLALGGSLTGDDGGGVSTDSAGAGTGGGRASQSQSPEADAQSLARLNGMALAPTIRSDHLAADVRRVIRLFTRHPVPEAVLPKNTPARRGGKLGAACPVPRLTDAQRRYQVRYQGAPAGLVVGPRHDGQADVTIYSCRTGGVELTARVPAP
jgi:hypothetical protein